MPDLSQNAATATPDLPKRDWHVYAGRSGPAGGEALPEL